LLSSLPNIPLWFEDLITVVRKEVSGFKPSRTGSLLGLRFAKLKKH